MKILTPIELKYVAKKIQLKGNRHIVLIDTTEEKAIQVNLGMRNIFCITDNNEVLWQVSVDDNVVNATDTFMYVAISDNGNLNADTFFGTEYFINIETGHAKRIGWHK
jgi:hypothetical protein